MKYIKLFEEHLCELININNTKQSNSFGILENVFDFDPNLGVAQYEINQAKSAYFELFKEFDYLGHAFNKKNLESIKKNGLNNELNFFSFGNVDIEDHYGGFDAYEALVKKDYVKDYMYPDPEGIDGIAYDSSKFLNIIKKYNIDFQRNVKYGITNWINNGLNLDLLFYFYMLGDSVIDWVVVTKQIPANKLTINKIMRTKEWYDVNPY